jgi:hypothetical protein
VADGTSIEVCNLRPGNDQQDCDNYPHYQGDRKPVNCITPLLDRLRYPRPCLSAKRQTCLIIFMFRYGQPLGT